MSGPQRAPAGKVASVAELLAIVHAMRQEAVRHYRAFAQRMRSQGEAAVAATFDFLAELEAAEVELLETEARALTGNPPDHALARWELPHDFDADAERSATISPYRALAIAVRNKERAFAFFSYLAGEAPSQPLRHLAERFARQELDHAARLRRDRRRAWRQEREAAPRLPRPASLAELLARAAAMERAAAAAHRALAAALTAKQDGVTAALFERAAQDEDALAAEISLRPVAAGEAPPAALTASTVFEGLRLLENAFDFYADAADHAVDEPMLEEGQRLAERALHRLATVHGALPQPGPQPG